MAEQSSTVAVFRALVMLVCLILIPVAAFCGGSFPAVVKAIQSGRWPTLADFRGPSGPPSSRMTEAPRFMPPPSAPLQPVNATMPGLAQGNTTPSGVVAAAYAAPITAPQRREAGPSTSFPQYQDPAVGQAQGLSPLPPGTGNLLPLDRQGAASRLAAPASVPCAAGGPSRDDQFKYVSERLKQLGATYFVLESSGDHELRFLCKMAVGGNPQVTKSFWSFDADALKAMTLVLRQVEDWQRGG